MRTPRPAPGTPTSVGARRRPVPRPLAVAAVALFALAACSSDGEDTGADTSAPTSSSARPDDGPGTAERAEPGTRTIAQGLQAPWSIAFHGRTALVSERDSGRILELTSGGSHRVVGTVPGVEAVSEAGLQGIAVRDNQLYTYATTGSDNRIQRFPITGSPGSLALGEPQDVLTGLPSGAVHNGGRIAFGPDGMLYATVGDAGDTSRSQQRDDLGGKILRMTPDGAAPADNPFAGSLVYSLGHRNPQGIAWGPDGTMYSSEFGQNTWDELNVIKPGANYGWPQVEGRAGRSGFTDPVQQWRPSVASPSGIAVIGTTIHVANLRGERLRAVPTDDLGTSTESLVNEHGRLRDAVPAPDGRLWVLTNNTDGRGSPGDGDDRILSIEAN